MEIQDIKQQLTINEVLQHYGLQPDKNHRLLCPFHPDKTPSLQIYPKTNTFCCFSSNCTAGTGDVIQFIQLKENCSKHEALVKATTLAGGNTAIASPPPPASKLFVEQSEIPQGRKADNLDKIAVLTKVFSYYKSGLPSSKKAVTYLQSRCIDYKRIETAFNSGGLHGESKNHHLVESMAKVGLLKARPAGGYNVWAKDCVIFPLKNADNKIVSLYGRSTTDNKDQRHFYLTGREGLYPCYPEPGATKLILTESIIDAASLLQQPEITTQYEILALYGTNGLTDEHLQAIAGLNDLQEIILILNADEPGEAAVAKHADTLKGLVPHVTISKVTLPVGEDVNSVLCTHDDAKVLSGLIEQRTEFFLSIEKENPPSSEIIATPALQPLTKLNTTNPELLIYNNCELHIEVLGGIKITGLDRMKVTLKVQHRQKQLLPIRDTLDLYNRTQTEQLIQTISENYDANIRQTETAISELTNELENYRIKRIEALQPKQEQQPELTAVQREAAISELKRPNLLLRTAQMIHESGIVGESTNSLIAYLVYCTRKQPVPLHIMYLGASGSGKTYLQERISELIPQEDKIEITQITENALYYFKQHELQHKLILIEDLDGALSVFYPLRELQTKRRISKTVTLKDSKGNLKTITLTVEGPVCVSGCTTKEKIYEDNANRCILLYTDQSREQDKRINEYQANVAAGEVNREREQQYKELFKNIQRILKPIQIINPYAKYIELPQQVFKPRRTMTLLLGFIEAVTFYHQYQREVKKDAAGRLYITTTVEDIEAAFALLKDVLFSKSDELTKATRNFFEQLKQLCQETGGDPFNAKAIRERLRINPGNMKRYLAELVRYGYIKANGNRYRKGSYEYSIVNITEYEALKSSVEQHLQSILEQIKNHTVNKASSSVVQ
jgi:DNA primase